MQQVMAEHQDDAEAGEDNREHRSRRQALRAKLGQHRTDRGERGNRQAGGTGQCPNAASGNCGCGGAGAERAGQQILRAAGCDLENQVVHAALAHRETLDGIDTVLELAGDMAATAMVQRDAGVAGRGIVGDMVKIDDEAGRLRDRDEIEIAGADCRAWRDRHIACEDIGAVIVAGMGGGATGAGEHGGGGQHPQGGENEQRAPAEPDGITRRRRKTGPVTRLERVRCHHGIEVTFAPMPTI